MHMVICVECDKTFELEGPHPYPEKLLCDACHEKTPLGQLKKQYTKLQAENAKMRKLLIKLLVKEYLYPACGDHPDMIGFITQADGKKAAAHQTADEALDNFLAREGRGE